jgi:hypothetical protein
MVLVGYTADGFPIYVQSQTLRSSYQVKRGQRPSGPGVSYDGTFVQAIQLRSRLLSSPQID